MRITIAFLFFLLGRLFAQTPGSSNLHIKKEIESNRFTVAGGQPGMEVTWLVIAGRNDPAEQWKPYVVEKEKTGKDRGKYYCPEAYGQPEEMRVGRGEESRN